MSGVRFPFGIVEYDANTWAMLYTTDSTFTLEYATSPKTDPHNWTKASGDNPILTVSGNNVRGGAVVKVGSTYHILYDTEGQFCYAYGTDLASLTKHSATDVPVFSGQGSGWEQFVRHPTLIVVDDVFHLFYDGRNGTAKGSNGDIGHATSADMIAWTRDANNPVLERGASSWESGDVGAPGICFFDSQYWLFYAGYDNSGSPFPHWIGCAVSSAIDGTWTKSSAHPFIHPGVTPGWSEDLVSGPTPLIENGNLHIYYEGSQGSNATFALGYATMQAS